MKSPLLWMNRVVFLGCASWVVISNANASPWFEPDDVYLRSDLQVLADAGLIHSPINTYPLKWARISDDLQDVDIAGMSASLQQSYAHVLYALQRAQMDKVRQRFKVGYADKALDDTSFSAPMTQKWQAQSSYELTEHNYAYRLAVNYQNAPDKRGNTSNEFSLDDSFFAYSFGDANVLLGAIQRWWGPTWVYNLAWGHTRNAVAGVDFSYDAYDSPLIGNWHVETFIGRTETLNENQQQWSSRFEFSPTSWLDVGLSYQKWFRDEGVDGYFTGVTSTDERQQDQYSGDIRLSLPTIYLSKTAVTQSVYAQGASLINSQSLAAAVFGWQTQFNIGQQYLRWIFEAKTLTAEGEDEWRTGMANRRTFAGLHNQLSINNSDMGEAKTVKLIWVTPHNWQWTLQGQRYLTINGPDQDLASASVVLPLAKSNRLTLGSDYNVNPSADSERWAYWASWDFRF
ncbi:capsule assembly Wzi family protein [Marinomonas arenicola]|uniref:Capsule assembly Wzi family protein n=1 Tax=Marinomonas arenicola TaxID=569601 RepID=A0ABU9G9V6_9GAMM